MLLHWRDWTPAAEGRGWWTLGRQFRQPVEQWCQVIPILDLSATGIILIIQMEQLKPGDFLAVFANRAWIDIHASRKISDRSGWSGQIPGTLHDLKEKHRLGRGEAKLPVVAHEQMGNRHESSAHYRVAKVRRDSRIVFAAHVLPLANLPPTCFVNRDLSRCE